MSNSAALLTTAALVVGYDVPLSRVPDLAVAAKDCVRIDAPNGVGKTTVYRTLLGLQPPLSGHFQLAAPACYLPAANALPDVGTVAQVLAHWRLIEGVEAETVGHWAERLGLGALHAVPPSSLSSGQARRLAVVRVLASPAPVLVLDEPFAGIDTHYASAIRHAITAKRYDTGCAIVYTAHDQQFDNSHSVALYPYGGGIIA